MTEPRVRQTALVTGASGGIGAGIVEVLTTAGIEVHALARRADRLADLAARTGCTAHVADLTDGTAMARLAEQIAPDILINNAGRGAGFEGIAAENRASIATAVETNVTATLDLIRLVLPAMVARGSGHIVNLGSVAGLYPSTSAVYGGTKGAVRLIGQNLRLELRGSGIRITDIRPGRVTSEFYDVALDGAEKSATAKATGIRELSPRDIGEAVLFAVRAPAHVTIAAIEIQPVEQTYGGTAFDPL